MRRSAFTARSAVWSNCRATRYARSFVLSADLDTSRIDANLRDGVLTLTIPRREQTRPRRIDVTAGNA